MSDSNWDLVYAIRISALNKRLKAAAKPQNSQALTADLTGGTTATATPLALQIAEIAPNGIRTPGPRPDLVVELDLADILVSQPAGSPGSTVPNPLKVARATISFQIGLQFVTVTDTGSTLTFGTLPPNAPGETVVTARVPPDVTPALTQQSLIFLQACLDGWLRQHLTVLSPVFALFGEGRWSLGALAYSYVQAVNEGEDLLIASAMLSDNPASPPPSTLLISDFVEDGEAAFRLSTRAFMQNAMLPVLNAFAQTIDKETCSRFKGNVFKYDQPNESISLISQAQGSNLKLQSGTVENEGMTSPLYIDQINMTYGLFNGEPAPGTNNSSPPPPPPEEIQLAIRQTAVLQKKHSYANAHSGVVRTEIVDWCRIYHSQAVVFEVVAEQGADGKPTISLNTTNTSDASSSEPLDQGTGNPVADFVLGIINSAVQAIEVVALGPVGIGLVLFNLACTTIFEEIDLSNIQHAGDRAVPVSLDEFLKPFAFAWGGIGDVHYKSAKLMGGLKVVGTVDI